MPIASPASPVWPLAALVLLICAPARASDSTPASVPAPPAAHMDWRQREAWCDTLRPGRMREAQRFYRIGRPDSLRALAARWQAECAGTKAGQESRTLALLLAAADGRLEPQIDDVTLLTLESWRADEPGASGTQCQPDSSDAEDRPDAATAAAYRAFVADLADDLLAQGGLDPQAAFVARWYAAEDTRLEELQEKRYEGTALRKEFLAWRAEKTVASFPAWIGGSFGKDFATLRLFEGIWTTALHDENIVYEATYLRPISLVFQRSHEVSEGSHPVIFTTTGPVTAALWGLNYLSTRVLVDPELPVSLSPLRYFWFAPNSRFDFCIARQNDESNWLSLGTRTEFVLARGADGERGILFSPRLAYVEGKDLPPRKQNAISASISIGPEYWWGFEEDSGWAGWSVELQLQGLSFGS